MGKKGNEEIDRSVGEAVVVQSRTGMEEEAGESVQREKPIVFTSTVKPRLTCAACSRIATLTPTSHNPNPDHYSPNPPQILADDMIDLNPSANHHSLAQQKSNPNSAHSQTTIINSHDKMRERPSLKTDSNSHGVDPSTPSFRLHFDHVQGDGVDSRPIIKCHVDHVDKNLQLHLNLDPSQPHSTTHTHHDLSDLPPFTNFSINCHNPIDGEPRGKFKIELFSTPENGFGVKIVDSDGHRGGNGKAVNVNNPSRSGANRAVKPIKPREIEDFDEIRVNKNFMSKVGGRSDHCKCSVPCGVPHCKALLNLEEVGAPSKAIVNVEVVK